MHKPDASDVARLAELLRSREKIDTYIAAIVRRPALIGHLGEFIAERIFDIELAESATQNAFDGHFTSGALRGRTVNVKWYARQEGLLDLHADGGTDFYLVLAGPKGSSGRGPRPWVIDSVHLFDTGALLRSLTVKIGVATSVKVEVWNAAEIYPRQVSQALIVTAQQRRLLGLFGSSNPGP